MADSGSQPPRCPCGFWGSEATAGLCSKCFKERQETSEPAQTPRTCSEDALRPTPSDVGKRHMESPLSGQMNPEKRLKLDCNVSKEETKNLKEKEIENDDTKRKISDSLEKNETNDKDNCEKISLDDSSNGASEKSLPSTTTTTATDTIAVSQKESGFKKRCNECRVKLNPALREIGRCKCGKVFCQLHRLPEQHICEFDHKEEGRREARQKMVNPEKQMGNNVERLQ